MESIYFCLKYCYGIKSFDCKFSFNDQKKAHIIYAPNGVMKTSFAKTLRDICLEKETRDELYTNRKTIRVVKHTDSSGVDYSKDEILVVEPYIEDFSSERMSVLLASRDLKDEYDALINEIDRKMVVLVTALQKFSTKKSAVEIMLADFGFKSNQLYELVDKIYDDVDLAHNAKFEAIQYGKLFTTEAEEILRKPDVVAQLSSYISKYKEILTKSSVFHETFDPYNAKLTLNNLTKTGFFDANHQVLLSGDVSGRGHQQYADVIETESRRIIEEEMLESFSALDKALERVAGTRDLRDYLSNNMFIIPELSDIPLFKKRIWASYLFSQMNQLHEAVLCYRDSKERIALIIQSAKEKETEWHETVEEFNRRFINLPFTIGISNREDVILRAMAPAIEFLIDGETGKKKDKNVDRKQLLGCLSDGERRALYLLQIIFELKARQKLGIQALLVIDDIADSFDYKNKYAIIEYLIDIIDGMKFKPIILTHNFDFFRTLTSRAGLIKSSCFAQKTKDGIALDKGNYFYDAFYYWKSIIHQDNAAFISSIAFFRNLEQYKDGQENERYKQLTALLHYKRNKKGDIQATEKFMTDDLCAYIADNWGVEKEKFKIEKGISVYELIIKTAREIANCVDDSIEIEKKLVLVIACRLLTDKYLINRIADDLITDAIQENQTRALKKLVTFNKNDEADRNREKIVDRVLIMSSENVHINAFMYEPILDLSLNELVNLLNDVSRFLIA